LALRRSLGGRVAEYGKDEQGTRLWGWRWREWSVSSGALPPNTFPESSTPVFRPHRPPIIALYGDDVPVYEATAAGIWAVIRYPIGPRLKIGR
jgi:hypothetical protein